ncbi:UPF0223 family protein [Sporosarcina pasteurii]|uniref:Uncharacterized protein n=1 Tax=Sporosarcina pasteurii TaxID=1474 RepID=A0A380BGL4_SPOPA|nr:UPF0223 family protein [Sporosarcina pasteurii]MDS9470446.1 UPF0223 family protein [Sporosarcina pasteurii]QBQ05855.1 UPF0223 family protein [Sporosarcina pasteurii]SUJ00260.1 Uncharacterised protein family (UPF0223) [Sporosarcina pasteurii]
MDYNYPLRDDWSTNEIIAVTSFYSVIEQAYEDGVNCSEVLEAYREFKKIVPSKSEEKTLFREFEQASGYRSYPIVREAQNSEGDKIIKGT